MRDENDGYKCSFVVTERREDGGSGDCVTRMKSIWERAIERDITRSSLEGEWCASEGHRPVGDDAPIATFERFGSRGRKGPPVHGWSSSTLSRDT
jgi:hypothetical protein